MFTIFDYLEYLLMHRTTFQAAAKKCCFYGIWNFRITTTLLQKPFSCLSYLNAHKSPKTIDLLILSIIKSTLKTVNFEQFYYWFSWTGLLHKKNIATSGEVSGLVRISYWSYINCYLPLDVCVCLLFKQNLLQFKYFKAIRPSVNSKFLFWFQYKTNKYIKAVKIIYNLTYKKFTKLQHRFSTLLSNVAKFQACKLMKKQFLIHKTDNARFSTMLLETQDFGHQKCNYTKIRTKLRSQSGFVLIERCLLAVLIKWYV